MEKRETAFRFAQREDTGLILEFIKALAEYEKNAPLGSGYGGAAGRVDI